MVELKGTHRFSNCPDYQRIITSLREGIFTDEDRDMVNCRVIGTTLKVPNSLTIRYATYFNNLRCMINMTQWDAHMSQYHKGCTAMNVPTSAIVIIAETQWAGSQKVPLSWDQRKVLFEQCPESTIKDYHSRRCDPVLCLFDGCPLMGVENEDVEHGIANGTQCILRSVHLKPGTIPQCIQMHGFCVNSVSVNDVEWLELEWQDSSRFKGRFRIQAKTWTYNVDFPVDLGGSIQKFNTKICLRQFPVVLNHATTGHKLQGKSLDQLVVAQWSKTKNWAYVVLSRVRSLEGLFLMEPIPDDIDFKPSRDYIIMMEDLRKTILKTPDDVADMKAEMDRMEISD